MLDEVVFELPESQMPYTDQAAARRLIDRILELQGREKNSFFDELRLFKGTWAAMEKSIEDGEAAYVHFCEEEYLRPDDYTILLGYLVRLLADKTGEQIDPHKLMEDLNRPPEQNTPPGAKRW